MKLGLLILVLAGLVGLIALPYMLKTYDLKEITAADLPAEGRLGGVELRAIFITVGISPNLRVKMAKRLF